MQQSLPNSNSEAVISEDQKYRYYLSRQWSESGKIVAFIGLNPSTADAKRDDPTIRRCINFARSWGGSKLVMGNLYAYRSTNPYILNSVSDPIGLSNDAWLDQIISESEIVVAAWGVHGTLHGRDIEVLDKYRSKLSYLKLTKNGHPSHPLYLSSSLIPINYLSIT